MLAWGASARPGFRYDSRMEKGDGLPALPAEHVAFIQTGVSIVVASHDNANTPSVARGVACRLSPDRRRVTVLLRPSRSAALMADLRSSASIAVVFSQPSTHRTIQIKGRDPEIGPVQADDQERVQKHISEFSDEVVPYGYSPAFARAMLDSAPDDLVAVTFTARDVFSQTPGPRAGERMP